MLGKLYDSESGLGQPAGRPRICEMRPHCLGSVLILAALAGCVTRPAGDGDKPESVTIFVAASTREAVEQIAKDFQAETGSAVEISPGPSSALAKQIDQGAPADLFLSADEPTADYLAGKGLVERRRVLLRNRLVVVVPVESNVQLQELADVADPQIKKLALAVEKVPAGEYSRQALAKAGVWEKVRDRVVSGTDVRVTLQLVERGADAGMVYYTDAAVSSGVRVALEVDPKLHTPIEYPLVLVRRDRVKDAARKFYDYVSSEKAAETFRRAKFEVAR